MKAPAWGVLESEAACSLYGSTIYGPGRDLKVMKQVASGLHNQWPITDEVRTLTTQNAKALMTSLLDTTYARFSISTLVLRKPSCPDSKHISWSDGSSIIGLFVHPADAPVCRHRTPGLSTQTPRARCRSHPPDDMSLLTSIVILDGIT